MISTQTRKNHHERYLNQKEILNLFSLVFYDIIILHYDVSKRFGPKCLQYCEKRIKHPFGNN